MRRLALICLAGLFATPATAEITTKTTTIQGPVVTAGGAVTETVFALGAGDRVVGVDAASLYPPSVMKLPRTSYFRALSAEGIIALGPKALIAVEGSGPPPALAQLQSVGVQVVTVPGERTVAGAEARVKAIAAALGRAAEGEALAQKMKTEIEAARAEAARLRGDKAPPKVLFVYARGKAVLNVGGADTGADRMITLAGGESAVTGFTGFKPMTAEAVVAAKPDVIVMTTRGLQSVGGPEGAAALPGVSLTPAGQAGRVVAMDDLLLLGFGPRTGEGLRTLAALIHGGR